jgi:hypothetical protein
MISIIITMTITSIIMTHHLYLVHDLLQADRDGYMSAPAVHTGVAKRMFEDELKKK